MTIVEIAEKVKAYRCALAEVIGGEPLLQPETPALCGELLAAGLTLLVETNGSLDISVLPEGCIRVIDIKPPSSGEGSSFDMRNLRHARPNDQFKFVAADRADFDRAIEFVNRHGIAGRNEALFSPVKGHCG
jgi:7-carboxy-7-deazaguanine synthase